MATATTPTPTNGTPAIAPGTSRGLMLPCPCCGEKEASVSLALADGETLTCLECEAEFTTDDVRQFIDRWSGVLAWLDTMPSAD